MFLVVFVMISSGCSIKKFAMNQVANALTGPGNSTVFTGDNDPELVGDALPFAIKMYESLLSANPGHHGLQLTTGSLYVMYANAFLHTPASMMSEDRYKEQEFLLQRSKNLYLRGRNILLTALDKKYPGFRKKIDDRKFDEALKPTTVKDVDLLYWTAAGWMGAFAIDPFDMKLGLTLPGAAACMERVMELDKNYGKGSIHNFYVLYYGSIPEYMGGSFEKARKHFKLAIETSKGEDTSPYISLATTVSIDDQNVEEFSRLLNKVLESDVNKYPANRLVNVLNQRKARWLLDHIDDFFLPKEGDFKDKKEETNDETVDEEKK
jgi:predicted anti-sigma-YlaC factor YlaD